MVKTLFKKFHETEDGAVTVDYVVITASVVGISVAVVATILAGMTTYATAVNENIEDIEVNLN